MLRQDMLLPMPCRRFIFDVAICLMLIERYYAVDADDAAFSMLILLLRLRRHIRACRCLLMLPRDAALSIA